MKAIQFESLRRISHRLMEISLNLIGFTDFFCKEMLTSLISFSSRNNFSLNLLLKASVVYSKKFLHFFLRGQPYRFREISQTSELKSPPHNFFQLARDLFILMDSAIICIHFRNSQPPISLKITAASLIRKTLVIILTNLLKQDLTFS